MLKGAILVPIIPPVDAPPVPFGIPVALTPPALTAIDVFIGYVALLVTATCGTVDSPEVKRKGAAVESADAVVFGTGFGIEEGKEEEDGGPRTLAAGVLRARELVMAVAAWIWPSWISEMMPSAWAMMDGNEKRRGRRTATVGYIL